MKPSELRIGNWVRDPIHNESDVRLSAAIFGAFLLDWKDELKPIPLNEEWLLKFGFDHWRDEVYKKFTLKLYSNHQHKYKITLHHLKKTNELNYYLHVNYDCEIELNNVHQLQNLYHALTGKELTIKTETA